MQFLLQWVAFHHYHHIRLTPTLLKQISHHNHNLSPITILLQMAPIPLILLTIIPHCHHPTTPNLTNFNMTTTPNLTILINITIALMVSTVTISLLYKHILLALVWCFNTAVDNFITWFYLLYDANVSYHHLFDTYIFFNDIVGLFLDYVYFFNVIVGLFLDYCIKV